MLLVMFINIISQAEIEQIDEEGLQKLDTQIKDLKTESTDLKAVFSNLDTGLSSTYEARGPLLMWLTLDSELKRLSASLTNDQLDQRIADLESDVRRDICFPQSLTTSFQ